jgi:hypothetical protein
VDAAEHGEQNADAVAPGKHGDGSLNPANPAEFRSYMLEAVDYGLMVLGGIVRQAIYDRIEKNHGLAHVEIPEQMIVFHKAGENGQF